MESAGESVTLDEILAARNRIAGHVEITPCPRSELLSELTGCEIFCKLEYLQRTGSFKERGARNALMLLSPIEQARGVITASAGNHALAVADHSREMKITSLVVMPRFAPLIKVATCRKMGAEVILHGDNIAEARELADVLARDRGLTYIHGYDAPAVIAGAGTIGLEILEQVPEVDAIVVPVGGAGLIAGLSLAVKTVKPGVEVIGVEPDHAASYSAALAAGHPTAVKLRSSLADGLAVPRVGDRAFAIARQFVDRVVTVGEDAIALAMLRLLELEKGVVEGAGATPLAALLAGELPELVGKRVVLVLAGGNVDPSVLSRVIDRGLVADGRLCRFTAIISDRPGGLADLAALLASTGASIRQIAHDRAFTGIDVSTVQVVCVVETQDREHAELMRQALVERGIAVAGAGTAPIGCDRSRRATSPQIASPWHRDPKTS